MWLWALQTPKESPQTERWLPGGSTSTSTNNYYTTPWGYICQLLVQTCSPDAAISKVITKWQCCMIPQAISIATTVPFTRDNAILLITCLQSNHTNYFCPNETKLLIPNSGSTNLKLRLRNTVNASKRWKAIGNNMMMVRWAMGVSLLEHRRNEEILEEAKVEPIVTVSYEEEKVGMVHACEEMRWNGHIRAVVEIKMEGKRLRGRPRLRWKDTVRRDLKARKIREDWDLIRTLTRRDGKVSATVQYPLPCTGKQRRNVRKCEETSQILHPYRCFNPNWIKRRVNLFG